MTTTATTWRAEHSRHRADTYFLETVDVLCQLGLDPDVFAPAHALLLLKPDAAVQGGMSRSVQWLGERGYRILAARAVRMTPLHLRALWYFNWHLASAERRRLADELSGICPSIVLLAAHPDQGLPCAVRLTQDKGPANPEEREPWQLRHTLGGETYLLNQVHSPDDPDDVLREISIYFNEAQAREFLASGADGSDRSQEALRLAQEVQASVEQRSGDLDSAAAVLREQIAAALGMRPRTPAQWREALAAAREQAVPLDPWSRIVVEAAQLPMRRACGFPTKPLGFGQPSAGGPL